MSPHHFHEDFNGGQDSGGEHTEDQGSSSLAHEFIDLGHQDVLSDVIPEQEHPSQEENYLHLGSHIDIDQSGHQELHGGTSYVNMKGHDGEKTEYVVDHSSSTAGGQSGADSYQLSEHHGISEDDSPALHTSSFAQDHDGHEAVSTFSFKDYNKGTSYSVKQTHGHKGLASVTRKSHDDEHETEHIHGDYGANDHAQSNLHEYNYHS